MRDSWSAPLEFNHRRNGFFYRVPDYALPLQRVSEGELVALFLAERLLLRRWVRDELRQMPRVNE